MRTHAQACIRWLKYTTLIAKESNEYFQVFGISLRTLKHLILGKRATQKSGLALTYYTAFTPTRKIFIQGKGMSDGGAAVNEQ